MPLSFLFCVTILHANLCMHSLVSLYKNGCHAQHVFNNQTTTTTRHFICQLEKIYKEEHKLKKQSGKKLLRIVKTKRAA